MQLRSVLLAVCLGVVLPALHAAPKVPLSAFVEKDQYSNPSLSPDGKYIAITVRIRSGERLVPVVTIYTLPDLKIASAIRMPAQQVPLSYTWIGKTRLAVVKGQEKGAADRPVAYGEVLATDVDGSNQDYLFGYDTFNSSRSGARYGYDYAWGFVSDVPRELNGHFFLTSNPWREKHSMLYDIDSARAVRKQLVDLPEAGLHFLQQQDGKPRFGFGTGEDTYATLYRYNDAGASWEKQQIKSARYVPRAFSADDSEFVVDFSADGGPDQLIKENLATGARTTLFADPRGSVEHLMFASRTGLPFGASSEVGIPTPHYFNADNSDAQLHKQLSAQFPGNVVSFKNQTDDGKTLLFSVASDRDPGSFYLLHRDTMKADLLFSALDKIDPDDMAERRPIAFKGRDGLDLYGYLTMPSHAPGAKLPMVLLPHGGPHGFYDRWYFDHDAQFLASRGYAVLQVNFRGSGGRGSNFREAGFRQWGAKIQDDLVDGVRWAIAQGEVDGARVCAYGISFGGYSALMLAAREPEMFKCAVGYAGVYDLKLFYKEEEALRNKKIFNFYDKWIGQDKAELDRISPVTLAEKITAPVLLVHGGKDEDAPPEHANLMRAALIKAGRPPEWFYAPDEGHGFYGTDNVTKFYTKLEAFLEKHIGK
jgi:dienelactone hydrolase